MIEFSVLSLELHVQSRISAGLEALGALAGQTLGRESKVTVKVC